MFLAFAAGSGWKIGMGSIAGAGGDNVRLCVRRNDGCPPGGGLASRTDSNCALNTGHGAICSPITGLENAPIVLFLGDVYGRKELTDDSDERVFTARLDGLSGRLNFPVSSFVRRDRNVPGLVPRGEASGVASRSKRLMRLARSAVVA